jgi:thymidylate synthase ThyX
MELNYPRFIHSEFMTHRMFSRNASSSRAIPVEKMIAAVSSSPAIPIHWGKNQAGMQAREELTEIEIDVVKSDWNYASKRMTEIATLMSEMDLHKQIVNRILEPFQWIKVIVTATEWDNFFKLRLHKDAQPEIQELARCMKIAVDESIPVELQPGEWHLPYVDLGDFDDSGDPIPEAIKCSVARCARVSYLNHDNSAPDISKDIALADMLLESGHMSPFEHIATPMDFVKDTFELAWENGVTHKDRDNNFWSGNFRGWVMYRQLIG